MFQRDMAVSWTALKVSIDITITNVTTTTTTATALATADVDDDEYMDTRDPSWVGQEEDLN